MNNLKKVYGKIAGYIVRNKAAILTVLAGVGVIGTGVSSSIAALKAKKNIDELRGEEKRKLTIKEGVKAAGVPYICPAIIAGGTIACLAGSHRAHIKREMAILGAYYSLKNGTAKYKKSVEDYFGKEHADAALGDAIVESDNEALRHALKKPHADGQELYCWYESGTFFWARPEEVVQAEYDFLIKLQRMWAVSENELLELYHADQISEGDWWGWNLAYLEEMCGDNVVEFFHTPMTSPEGIQYTEIEATWGPIEDFANYDGLSKFVPGVGYVPDK